MTTSPASNDATFAHASGAPQPCPLATLVLEGVVYRVELFAERSVRLFVNGTLTGLDGSLIDGAITVWDNPARGAEITALATLGPWLQEAVDKAREAKSAQEAFDAAHTCENCSKVRSSCEPFTCPTTGDPMALVCAICREHLTTGKTWQADLADRLAVTEGFIVALDSAPRAYAFPDAHRGQVHIVARDPEFPEQWRHTRWDRIGPAGHSTRTTFREAVVSAHELDAQLENAVPVDSTNVESVVLRWITPGLELPRNGGEHEAALTLIDAIVQRVAARS